jgi:hypothetical protein
VIDASFLAKLDFLVSALPVSGKVTEDIRLKTISYSRRKMAMSSEISLGQRVAQLLALHASHQKQIRRIDAKLKRMLRAAPKRPNHRRISKRRDGQVRHAVC